MKSLLYNLFICTFVFCFNAQAKKLSPEDLVLLKEAENAKVLLMSDSSCRSCSKLIKKMPSFCDQLKPKTFSVLATGNIKKNKKKLSSFEKKFTVLYSKNRRLLSKMKAPATPTMLVDKENFVVGYNAITKYIKENTAYFCMNKTLTIKL